MSMISIKELSNCKYPCKDRKKFFITFVLSVAVLLCVLILSKEIFIMGISLVVVKLAIFMCLLLTIICLLIIVPVIIVDYLFFSKIIRSIQVSMKNDIWEEIENKHGARITWVILREPINYLLLGKLLEKYAEDKRNKNYLELAYKMIDLAIIHEPKLKQISMNESIQSIAQYCEKLTNKNSILKLIYFLWNVPIIKIGLFILVVFIFLFSIFIHIVRIVINCL